MVFLKFYIKNEAKKWLKNVKIKKKEGIFIKLANILSVETKMFYTQFIRR